MLPFLRLVLSWKTMPTNSECSYYYYHFNAYFKIIGTHTPKQKKKQKHIDNVNLTLNFMHVHFFLAGWRQCQLSYSKS